MIVPLIVNSHNLDTESRIEELERCFTDIQDAALQELESREASVELVKRQLFLMPRKKENKRSIILFTRRKKPFKNLDELFAELNMDYWNFLEYHLLKQLIMNLCSEGLRKRVKRYGEDIQTFQRITTVTELIKYRGEDLANLKGKRIPQSFKKLVMKHKINPETCTLAELETLRKKTCIDVKLCDFALQIHTITTNCIIVEWIIPEEIVEILSLFYYSEVGQELLRDYQVESIVIDNKSLYSVSINIPSFGKESIVQGVLIHIGFML